MEYVLNKIPVPTTNGFNVNSLKLDLDLPTSFNFREFDMQNTDDLDIKYSLVENFTSEMGLSFSKALNIDITIKKIIADDIIFKYEFSNDDVLIDNINITLLDNTKANIIFKYISLDNNKHFHCLKQNINVLDNSGCSVSIINLLNKDSYNFVECISNVSTNSKLDSNIIDIGGNTKVYNYRSLCDTNGTSNLNNIYIGLENSITDLNYHYINKGSNSNTNINVVGVLNNKAVKTFKGTIDFLPLATKSTGIENEDCILLSDTAISRSAPIILCGEEDVVGVHSEKVGKVDKDKLFYLMSRGLSENDSKKLIILSKFNTILDKIGMVNEISDIIDSYI